MTDVAQYCCLLTHLPSSRLVLDDALSRSLYAVLALRNSSPAGSRREGREHSIVGSDALVSPARGPVFDSKQTSTSVKVLVRWANSKRLTNRLPKLV